MRYFAVLFAVGLAIAAVALRASAPDCPSVENLAVGGVVVLAGCQDTVQVAEPTFDRRPDTPPGRLE